MYSVGSNEENYRIAVIVEIVREELDQDLDVTYFENEQTGPSYRVNFDQLTETGFETEWTLRGEIRDIASKLTGEGREMIQA